MKAPAESLVPLYGFVEGDVLGLVILVRNSTKVHELSRTLSDAASPRVAPKPGLRVFFRGEPLDEGVTVAEAGLTALDRVDLRREDEHGV